MKNIMFVAALIIMNFNNLFSQTLSGKINDNSLGFSFIIPSNWEGTKTEQGYLLVSQNEKGFVLVTLNNFNSLEEMERNTREGIDDGVGTKLSLIGDLVKNNNNTIAGKFTGILENQLAAAYVVSLLSPYSGGVSILVFVEEGSYSDVHQKLAEQISSTVEFVETVKTSLAEDWKQALNNCRLTYMNSYNSGYGSGGMQDKIIIDLCEKGYFNYQDESNVVMNQGDVSGYSSGNQGGEGEWKIVEQGNNALLVLNFGNGEMREFSLSFDGEKTFLNGKRYFRTYKDSEVEGTQPNCF